MKLSDIGSGSVMVLHCSESSLIGDVKSKKDHDSAFVELKALAKEGKIEVFS